jgi:hypothetical protein
MPRTGRASDAGPSDCRSISRNHDDGDDNDGRDQRERTIECFRTAPCGSRFERGHDLTSLSLLPKPASFLLPRPASFCKYQSLVIGRSTELARFFERLGSLRAGRHLTRFLEGIQRSRGLDEVIGGDSAFRLLSHVLSGRPGFAARPPKHLGFHRLLRCCRGLDTTALLALECPALEARGSALDPGEKHSLVTAHRAARPLDRGEVGGADRLKFRQWHFPAAGALRTLWSPMTAKAAQRLIHHVVAGIGLTGQYCSFSNINLIGVLRSAEMPGSQAARKAVDCGEVGGSRSAAATLTPRSAPT